MSNTKQNINPGYGYRLLNKGENFIAGDERHFCGEWKLRSPHQHGTRQGFEYQLPTRRKIDVGAGYELVPESARPAHGMEVSASERVEFHPSFWHETSPELTTIADVLKSFNRGSCYIMAFRRKVPVIAPERLETKPAILSNDIPATPSGYRRLADSETVRDGDHYLTRYWRGSDRVVTNTGKTAKEAVATMFSHGTRAIIRPVTAPAGYRLIENHEMIVAGDAWFIEGGSFVTPAHSAIAEKLTLAELRSGHRLRYDANCIFVRPLPKPVETAEARLTRELSEAKDQIAKLVARCTTAETTAREKSEQLESASLELTSERETMLGLRRTLVSKQGVIDTQTRVLAEKNAEIEAMKKNASGNAVLVTHDGFSKPTTVPNFNEHVCVPFHAAGMGFFAARFSRVGTTDGFGRTVYKQAS